MENTNKQSEPEKQEVDEGREITVEVLYESADQQSATSSGACPMNVKIERVPRGFKVVASCARCM